MALAAILEELGLAGHPRVAMGVRPQEAPPGVAVSENPATGEPLAGVRLDDPSSYERELSQAVETFRRWRRVPAPVRGQVVRAVGEELRRLQRPLGTLISLEVGKIRSEGLGEVQETIDMADFAVGLSRQLYGVTMPSERPGHRLMEQWHPLGPIGVITAFNFPHAVWGWNAMLGAVCGDVIVWKPSLLAPLSALATHAIAERVAASLGHPGVFRMVLGHDEQIGERLIADRRLPLISATGSCRMGRRVGQVVASRLGRCLLELGGNNGVIVTPSADLDLALRYVLFGAVGTAGQRCTSTRRLIVHESIAPEFVDRLVSAYRQVRLGDPLEESTLMGPLIRPRAVEAYLEAVRQAQREGGQVLIGGARWDAQAAGQPRLRHGYFVLPTIIRAPASNELPIARQETFAPILYVFTYRDFDEALALHNAVDQGLSSGIFTRDVREAERFLGPEGSDCGIANVNLGTSGAEIGGAFGGEKDTGGGREAGSDAWKAYMRRQTSAINGSGSFQLAQGIRFD